MKVLRRVAGLEKLGEPVEHRVAGAQQLREVVEGAAEGQGAAANRRDQVREIRGQVGEHLLRAGLGQRFHAAAAAGAVRGVDLDGDDGRVVFQGLHDGVARCGKAGIVRDNPPLEPKATRRPRRGTRAKH